MLLPLIFLGWCWDRVLTDCRGGAEQIEKYLLMATGRMVVQATCCCDDEGLEYDCTHMEPIAPRIIAEVPEPGIGLQVCTDLDPVNEPWQLPPPDLGVLYAWPWPSPENPNPVIAVDLAGHRSGDLCP